MITVEEYSIPDDSKVIKFLGDQGYTTKDLENHLRDVIINNYDTYSGLAAALDSDVSTFKSSEEVKEYIKSLINDYYKEEVLEKSDEELDEIDCIELLDELIDDSNSIGGELYDLNIQYDGFAEAQQKIWDDDLKYLNWEYNRSRM